MTVYYNERDPFAAQWLRELIDAGHIARGVVDERSIEDVKPSDLTGYTQCHFFAGIGVWSYALRQAGWPDDRPVWTGSCPCQPFSAAGKGDGFADERHLWPAWFHLIQYGKQSGIPIFGEQVASKDGLPWIDLVSADLEGAGYACWPVDLCAAGVGAPHIRQRLFFVADAEGERCGEERVGSGQPPQWLGNCGKSGGLGLPQSNGPEMRGNLHRELSGQGFAEGRHSGRLADPNSREQQGEPVVRGAECHGENPGRSQGGGSASPRGHSGRLADTDGWNTRPEWEQRGRQHGQQPKNGSVMRGESQGARPNDGPDLGGPGPTNGLWRDADWLFCRDGKWRPVEPGTFPLAHGAPARVGRLRGYGNAINAEVATAFIKAYLGTI